MTERKATKNKQKTTFINIPRSWTYLIGYEYQAINRHGEPKLTKGQKPVIKRIDHVDLLLLDEIRGFSERGNKECFEEAVALAQAVGMIGQEKQLCDKVLQLCGLGFVKASRKIDDGKLIPKVVLEADTKLVNDVAEARKEWILEQQRMDSRTGKFGDIVMKNYMLQEYLKEYLQEQLPEERVEGPPDQEQGVTEESARYECESYPPNDPWITESGHAETTKAVRPKWRYDCTENHFPDLEEDVGITEYPTIHGISVYADDFDDDDMIDEIGDISYPVVQISNNITEE